jgi:hypothetical protein
VFLKFQKFVLQKSKTDFITPFQHNTHMWVTVATTAEIELVRVQLTVAVVKDTINVSHLSNL